MAIALAAAAWTLLTLWEAHVTVVLRVRYDPETGTSARLRVFFADTAARAERVLLGPGARKGKKQSGSAGGLLLEALGRLAGENAAPLRVRARICAGDAAATALLCGACFALNALANELGIALAAAPVYDAARIFVEADARARLRIRQVAAAALRSLAARARA